MDLETFEKAVRSMEGWYQPGKVLGVIAGEPTLHPQFEQLSRKFQELWGPKENTGNGVAPVADRDAYATERLFDRSNGRGLWTSLGKRYYEHYETIQDVYSHHNQNDHSAGGKHQANLIDRKTICEALGMTDEEWIAARDACPIQNEWSATITPFGAYACEQMAHIDILFNEGKRAWPIEPGWWKRTPDQFGEQLEICNHCSLCVKAPARVDAKDRDIISEPNRIALEMAGSPAVKKGNYDIYDPVKHLEHRDIHDRKDHYVGESGCRVSPENRSMMPKKLSAVVVCVGRAEHLRQTLEHNAKQVDELIIVSDHETGDRETFRVVAEFQYDQKTIAPNCKTSVQILSGRWKDRNFAFNKGAMLNDGLRALSPDSDWVVFTDADIFLPDNLLEFVFSHALNPGVLYGASRDNGSPGFAEVNAQPNGYFQLFNRRALAIRDAWPAVMSEEFCSAGGVDSWFLSRWPKSKRVMIPELTCRHIPHGEGIGVGWNGDSNEKRWRQIGLITAANGAVPTVDAVRVNGPEPIRVRLVDTLRGDTWEGELRNGQDFPREIVTVTNGPLGVVFKERVLWDGHLHVSAWC